MIKKHFSLWLLFFCAAVFCLTLRGISGSPRESELNGEKWKENGPFELSPERGRFALLYSLMENHSFFFSPDLGAFAEPDVGLSAGRFVSLFAPGLSFLAVPGYLLGRALGGSVLGAVATVSLFALANIFLIRAIAQKLGADPWLSALAALAFAFGSPAFTYAVSLYQHHLSLFLLLAAVYLLLGRRNFWSDFLVWLFLAFSFLVDYPNAALALPAAAYACLGLFSFRQKADRLKVGFRKSGLAAGAAVLIPIFILLWFNRQSYGDPWRLSATLARTKDAGEKSVVQFFNGRDLERGLWVHLVSPDRGIIFFAPVLLLGILGLVFAYEKMVFKTLLLGGVAGIDLLLYSLWGDPWGGWAFGSRYLIPAYAVLAIFTALFLTYFKKNKFLLLIFSALFVYSVLVNTLGALTTSKNPPSVEIAALEKVSGRKQEKTFLRNWSFINESGSKSFVYQVFLKNRLTAVSYFQAVAGLILTGGGLIVGFCLKKERTVSKLA